LVGTFSNGKDVRWALRPTFAHIDLHSAQGVDGEPLVGVNGDTEKARVGVDQLVHIPDNRVPKNTGITQIGEIGHVIRAVKLGRVNLADLLLLEDLNLGPNFDRNFASILGLYETLQVATIRLPSGRVTAYYICIFICPLS
jgi:hypothetical protein